MSEYKQLYNIIKGLLPTNYGTTFSYIDETTLDSNRKTVPTTKMCAIYLKSGLNGIRLTDSGSYLQESVRLILNIYGERSVEGIEECLEYCDTVKNTLDSTFNKEFTDTDTSEVMRISNISRNGNVNELGRNGQGVPVYSINYLINYSKGGN